MKKKKGRYLTNEGCMILVILAIGSYFPIRAIVFWVWGV